MTDKELVDALLNHVEGLSDREAADLTGFAHQGIRKYRNGNWRRLQAATRRRIEALVGLGTGDGNAYADALEAAADELERQAAALREKARQSRG